MSVELYSEQTPIRNRSIQSARELSASSLLWRSVLAQSIRDIYSGSTNERNDVIRWLKSGDFDVVCEFAHVDITSMREQIASLAVMPENLSRKYGKLLRDKIMEGIHRME